jgi:hypothetical protein
VEEAAAETGAGFPGEHTRTDAFSIVAAAAAAKYAAAALQPRQTLPTENTRKPLCVPISHDNELLSWTNYTPARFFRSLPTLP